MRWCAILLVGLLVTSNLFANELVRLPYSVANRKQFTADGRFILYGNRRYEVKTQRLVTLVGPTVGSYFSQISGNGQVQFGNYFMDNWSYGFRRTAAGFSVQGSDSGFSYVESDVSGQNVLWSSTYIPHGGGTITYRSGVIGWPWFSWHLAYEGLALSGNGKFGFFRGREFGDVFRISESEFQPISTAEWQQPQITACSHDGKAAIGYDSGRGFLWREGVGFLDLGELIGSGVSAVPRSISSDGNTVTIEALAEPGRVYVYVVGLGVKTLTEFLVEHGFDLSGWTRFDSAYLGGFGEGIIVAGSRNGEFMYAHGWYQGSHISVDLGRTRVLPGGAVKGKVILSEPKPHGRRIALTSNSPNMTIDSDAWVPAGKTVASFTVRTNPASPGDRYTVTAQTDGLIASDDLEVVAYFKSLTITPTVLFDHYPITITANLDRVSIQSLALQLSYSPYFSGAPENIIIYSGDSSGSVTTTPAIGYSMTTPSPLTVTARDTRDPYARSKTASVTLYPIVDTIAVFPSTIASNGSGTGTVSVAKPAPAGGITYTLTSFDAVATVPATVTLPPGALSVDFPISVGIVPAPKTVYVQARYDNSLRNTAFQAVP